jgi:protein-tyrosine-phosphatase
MREPGIDISAEYPKPWTDEVVRAADDLAGLDLDDARPIRDEIERRVRRMLAEP